MSSKQQHLFDEENAESKSRNESLQIYEVFNYLDTDRDGFLTFKEATHAARMFGVKAAPEDFTRVAANDRVALGSLGAFLSVSVPQTNQLAQIKQMFHLMDRDRTGVVSVENIRAYFKENKDSEIYIPDEDLAYLAEVVERNQRYDDHAGLTQEDFIRLLSRDLLAV
eukprot:TRINITY_DN8534_c0_g1::TRINITY_DN8534_c0_g1_i1::g.8579::m.8579 TRINITY_DN8534_c0_g1::TRINITY_DN8534_c0_g1_i1::g.8579  ORF type:complete len:167 (+),score=16.17,sp/Q8K4K1/CETN4_MOUSE/27.08/1e-07,EF-hand_6/PF13405.1/2.8e-05,EF-hand_6/PF13405.1/0.012,EF-hand_6/PF13405.1/9.3e+02,EF-hand_1/PF00036.27/0.00026,EF-hand_1/PF00036.27/0.00084,EF-hand_1/PF00036.27/2.5e+03,EF-hand_7/PF13499.1/0.00075,EF-hand_7/PF13499.1/0.0015,EF-hand_5/PF13202.1/0.0018,EF-hand_5/PF13202.1/0.14,EF-hand_8/PF13833.1/0.036,EF-ha